MLATTDRADGDTAPVEAAPPAPGAGFRFDEGDRREDARLVARVAVGDERALGIIYDQHSAMVFGLARRVTRRPAAAEEITQEVFTALWERPQRYDPAKGSLKAFLGVLAHRRAVDWVRREEAMRRRSEREALDLPPAPGDASEPTVAADTAARVRAAVDALPADQREAVWLAYFGGLTYRDVAQRLGIPEGTAKSRLRLALAKLAATLNREGLS